LPEEVDYKKVVTRDNGHFSTMFSFKRKNKVKFEGGVDT
jgi:hypothetical protein